MLGANDEHNYILRLHIGRSSMASRPVGRKNDEACAAQAQMQIIDDRYILVFQSVLCLLNLYILC